ncbi:MAG: ATP-binding protein, partial [Myxococcota bacterium]
MLTWIDPSGFKSFSGSDDGQPIAIGPLTLLLGGNASGKSNLLELIRFFQGLASGFSLVEVAQGVQRGGREIWPSLRGGITELYHIRSINLRAQVGIEITGGRWEYGVEIPSGEVSFWEEWLSHKPSNRSVTLRGTTLGETTVIFADGDYQDAAPYLSRLPVEPGRAYLLRPSAAILKFVKLDGSPVREFLAHSRILDLNTARMRDYAQMSDREIGSEGEHLSAVLFHLCERDGFKADIVDWLSELCAPRIRDIDFVQVTETRDVLLKLIEEGGAAVTARSVSDGTLRFLGLLAALWTLPRGAMICLEEVETGLHPSRIDLLIELLVQVVRDRELQIIATTHSPRVLHALGQAAPEHLARAVVFARPPDAAGTVTRSLG